MFVYIIFWIFEMEYSVVSGSKLGSKTLVMFVGEDLKFNNNGFKHKYDEDFKHVCAAKKTFKGKKGEALYVVTSKGAEFEDMLVIGYGKPDKLCKHSLMTMGAKIATNLNMLEKTDATICVNFKAPKDLPLMDVVAKLYVGAGLKNYKFNEYYVDKANDHKVYLKKLNFYQGADTIDEKGLECMQRIIESTTFTRDLVSKPGNVIYPKTFVESCKKFTKLGIKLKVLAKKDLQKLGMGALLGVAQGSEKEPYVMIMEWHGDSKKKKDQPIAFLGKGVTFDSGGISLKPSANMGDMKYDMAGAGAVVGLMHLLASRKAKVNAIGVVGLVENMPSGTAQRPGDVVKTMSGQTVEIDNTDAEGRLVLADILHYTKKTYNPKFMINLATLTGAIVIALGENYCAGMFSNDDDIADKLTEAGKITGERVWRLPMDDFFDKQVNSEIADIRNTGSGRGAGSITAAQFLKRFVGDTPWVHLDIAGMAWDKAGSDLLNKGATGYGVRLLNMLVHKYFE